MANQGLGGAFLLGVGGTILFYSLYQLLWDTIHDMSMPLLAMLFLSFIGFLIFGIGLWLIVQSEKTETKKAPL
jgi:hypothetical protein